MTPPAGRARSRLAIFLLGAGACLALAACTGDGGGAEDGPASSPVPASLLALGAPRDVGPDVLGLDGDSLYVDGAAAWSSDAFRDALAALQPGHLRLFDGDRANIWDWREGRLVEGEPYPDGVVPPRVTLPDLATTTLRAGAEPVYDLNLTTATLEDNLAMLREARRLGLPVRRVELGNELYAPEDRNVRAFPDGQDYAEVAERWTAAVTAEFPEAEVAVVASAFTRATGDERFGDRVVDWNDAVVGQVDGAHAVTLHFYVEDVLPEGAAPDSPERFSDLVAAVDAEWDRNRTEVLDRLPDGTRVWVTEWSLMERDAPVHGTWAHGLGDVVQGLHLLGDPRVELASLHAAVGDAAFAALFGGEDSGRFAFFARPDQVPPTVPYARSAVGAAMAPFFEAVHEGGALQPVVTAERDVRGLLVTPASGGPRLALVNLAAGPTQVDLPAGRWSGTSVTALSPSTRVSGPADVRQSDVVSSDRVVLPPWSVVGLAAGSDLVLRSSAGGAEGEEA